ncbi:hypothetical protein DYI25_16400 [Mesobacillus boroniphilus]|uniref:Uncharacterized protein n=1 Tax=Mesobacillus boroniphilus TaxID=308892 RepID=A0A944CMR2_9BACI|nr:hypothetical protein [Mesobacillus boroniphilus]
MIRTILESKGAKVDENRCYSDRFRGIRVKPVKKQSLFRQVWSGRRKAVKITSGFRQVWQIEAKSCQNNVRIQTGLPSRSKKLSEKRPYSDRFGK